MRERAWREAGSGVGWQSVEVQLMACEQDRQVGVLWEEKD